MVAAVSQAAAQSLDFAAAVFTPVPASGPHAPFSYEPVFFPAVVEYTSTYLRPPDDF